MCDSELFAPAFSFSILSVEPDLKMAQQRACGKFKEKSTWRSIGHVGVDLKVVVLSVVCDDLWYAKMTFGQS